jgi:diadenosine tetraphosphate (Ap4A) HIT family hydrolase
LSCARLLAVDGASASLELNQSGRLWSEDPAGWRWLCSEQGCPHCREGTGDPRWVLAETDAVWVSAFSEAPLSGYVCVFAKAHVVEPFELPEALQVAFFLDCMAVARGVAGATAAVKMNYEIHGNTVPHLHMHLFPRTPGDVYVGLPNHCRATFHRTRADLDRLRAAVRAALGDRAFREGPAAAGAGRAPPQKSTAPSKFTPSPLQR